MMREFKKIKKRIFKPIKYMDAEIRFIENSEAKDKSLYWMVEIGLCESMGERGYNYTLFFDSEPTETEIIKGIKEHIKEQIETFSNSGLLGAYEEQQLKILKGVES